MTIRPARPSDAPTASQLIRAAIADLADFLTGSATEPEILHTLTDLFQQPGNRLSFQHTLVKEIEGQVAGLIIIYHGRDATTIDRPILDRLRHLKNDPTITLDKEANDDEFYIDTLSVSPHFSGQGIGTALIHAAEQRALALHHPKISLNVDQDNHRALHLYQRLDYQTTNTILIHNRPYFHMVKRLF